MDSEIDQNRDATTKTESSEAVTRHKTFYCENVIFKVENTLFQVPRYKFETLSPVFANMFDMPSSDDPAVVVEGRSDENPIVLEGYTAVDFERLLSLLYPSGDHVSGDPVALTSKAEWLSVLKLATVWDMAKIREIAIGKLTLLTMTPTEKIRLGREYRVSSWFVDGMKELATTLAKAPAVSVDTIAADIGWESAARIMTIVSNHKTAEMAREKIIPSSGEVKLRLNNVYCQREVCSINEGKRRVCPLNHSRLSLSGSSRRQFRPIGSTFDPRDAVFTDEEYFTQNDDDSEELDIGGPLGQPSRRRHPLSGLGGSLSLASTLSGGSQSRGNCSIDWSLLKTQVTEASSRDVPADTIRKAFEEEIKSLH